MSCTDPVAIPQRNITALLTLPDRGDARLAVNYQAAVAAIELCDSIDECQDWANKAEALASYAKQAGDDVLQHRVNRIRARAVRRCGELLLKIPPARGHKNGSALTRSAAAQAAGLSERQRKTALRIASLAAREFEDQVESESPATVTELAEQGTLRKPKPLIEGGEGSAEDIARAAEARQVISEFAIYCKAHDAVGIDNVLEQHERSALRSDIRAIDAWFTRIVAGGASRYPGLPQ